jgi:voltage-gated potassium channel
VHGLTRPMERFLAKPVSVRAAMRVIVVATLITVPLGGVAVRIANPDDIHSVWLGMWWSLQTATTVGYGDVVPQNWAGRVVGGAVMLFSVAFLAIVTAAVTSTFVERARRARLDAQDTVELAHHAEVESRLDDLVARLDRIEAALRPRE